jgi:hypothetical protein
VVPILHPSTIPPSHFSTTCPSPLSPRHPTQQPPRPLSLLHHPAFTSPHTSHDSTTPPLSPLDTTPPAQCPPITLPLSLLHHPAQPSPPPSRPLIPPLHLPPFLHPSSTRPSFTASRPIVLASTTNITKLHPRPSLTSILINKLNLTRLYRSHAPPRPSYCRNIVLFLNSAV